MSKNGTKYYEDLFKDLEYIQNNPRGIQSFSNKVAQVPFIESSPTSLAPVKDLRSLLDQTNKEIGSFLQELKTEKDVVKQQELFGKMKSTIEKLPESHRATYVKNLKVKMPRQFLSFFTKSFGFGQAEKLLEKSVAKEVGQAAKSLGQEESLFQKTMEFLKRGLSKTPKAVEAMEPLLRKASPTVLEGILKAGRLGARPLIAFLHAIPFLTPILVMYDLYTIYEVGSDLLDRYQTNQKIEIGKALTTDEAFQVKRLLQYHSLQTKKAPTDSEVQAGIKTFQELKKKLDPQQAYNKLADQLKVPQLSLTTVKQLQDSTPEQLEQLKIKELLQNQISKLIGGGESNPAKIRQQVLENLDTTFIDAKANFQSLMLRKVSQSADESWSAKQKKEYAKQVLTDPKSFQSVYQSAGGKSEVDLKVSPESSPAAIPTTSPTQQTSQSEMYTVQSGDTLSGIAKNMQKKYPGITWQDIMAVNKGTDTAISDANKIQVNQKIKIPTKPLNAKNPEGYQPLQREEKSKQETQPVKQETQPTKQELVKQETQPAKQEPTKQVAPGKKFVTEFKDNVDNVVNEKNLGKEGDPSQGLVSSRAHMKQVAEKGAIGAYNQAFQYLRNKDILNDVADYHRKQGSEKGMTAEDLISLNRSYSQRTYRPGDVRAINKLTETLKQSGSNFWKSHENLVLALRKLIFAKAQKAGVDIANAQNP